MDERQERVDEKPATHKKKTQLYLFLVVGGIFLVLLVNFIYSLSTRNSEPKNTDTTESVNATNSTVKAQDLKGLFVKDKQDVITQNSQQGGSKPTLVKPSDQIIGGTTATPNTQPQITERQSPYTRVMPSTGNNLKDNQNSPEKMRERFETEEINRALRARYDRKNFDAQSSSTTSGNAYGSRESYTGITGSSNDEIIQEIGQKRQAIQGQIAALNKDIQQNKADMPNKLNGARGQSKEANSIVNKALSGGDFTGSNPSETLSDNAINNNVPNNVVGYTKDNSYNANTDGLVKMPIGTVINAITVMTAISDYQGGSMKAMITTDIYDASNTQILAPKGSEVIIRVVKASGVNEVIQNRVAFLPSWLVLPNGDKIDFSKTSGLDQMGIPAVKGDEVDRHFMAQFFGVAAYALVGTKTSYEGSGGNNDQSFAGNFGSGARSQAGGLAQKYLQVVPTVELYAGKPIRIILEDEIFVKPWGNIYEDYTN
ncbi:TrbI/VirB10 family protein [Proteus mirabilis]|uniref:TrbI/VirB10 family protein n=1 Tax=Proteus mirabilis TaxID=584 RepID=UPI0034D5372C